jgi:hypothetical protein
VKEPIFDIFSGRSEKDAMWLEAVQGLSKARQRMEQIAEERPGRYFLFCSSSHSIPVRLETLEKPRSKPNAASFSEERQGAQCQTN